MNIFTNGDLDANCNDCIKLSFEREHFPGLDIEQISPWLLTTTLQEQSAWSSSSRVRSIRVSFLFIKEIVCLYLNFPNVKGMAKYLNSSFDDIPSVTWTTISSSLNSTDGRHTSCQRISIHNYLFSEHTKQPLRKHQRCFRHRWDKWYRDEEPKQVFLPKYKVPSSQSCHHYSTNHWIRYISFAYLSCWLTDCANSLGGPGLIKGEHMGLKSTFGTSRKHNNCWKVPI